MLDTYRELLDIVVKAPQQLRAAAEAAQEPAEGEWTAAQVMAHMAIAERMWMSWLNPLVREREPVLSFPKDYDRWEAELMPGSLDDNVAAFNSERGETVSVLMGMSLRDWERRGIDSNGHEMSVEQLVEGIIEHDAEHLAQLESLA
jgi:uncharacterized damage-inducible protein DinB